MKKLSILALCAGLSLCAVNSVSANRGLWSAFEGKAAPSQNPKKFLPREYKIIQLDHIGIKQLLAKAGTSVETGVNIDIPTPDGGFKTFKVWNTPVMESEIAAQFPDIQTYTGSLIGDPSQTIKLSMTPMGFTARTFAFEMEQIMAIESYGYDANGYYTLAAGKDLYQSSGVGCNPKYPDSHSAESITIDEERAKVAQRTFGNSRRTYRLALACTGDYALAVSGTPNPTVSQILAIMNSMVNNANGVWEREISISTKIINNNTAIIYLDPMTDPYLDDTDHGTVIDENQANHDIFIGNANYDLGHVLTAQGGGLAQLASICGSGAKASGVSGSSGPTDIGTITHEVGHQMGAGHTFTSEAGGCGGNGMATSSVEPGSGTTIMSYNGACAADNTPLFTNPLIDYYNQFNLNEMQQVLTTLGATCGTTSLGQAPVNMANINLRYIIPANTPFELIAPEATNTVSTNSAPVYCWEQNDLGPINMVEAQGANAATGPLFMSMPSRLSRYREFPRYETLAAGNYGASGERLTAVNRNLRFKVTARSIALDGWGTTNTTEDNVRIKAVQSSVGEFRVNAPAANLDLQPNDKFDIKWTIGNTLTPQDSIMTGSVNIYLSIDGGMSFPIILATNVPNNGEYQATAPNYFATNARVKVKAVGNIYFDVSKVGFRINGTVGVKPVDVSNNIQVYPNPASDIINIKNSDYKGEALEMVMLNVLGQEVWTGKMEAQTAISTTGMAKGAYYIHFKSAKSGKYGVQKVLVK